ncbi:MAG: ABC transporter substrate-binding protein [Bacteriovoracaceae bacterium]
MNKTLFLLFIVLLTGCFGSNDKSEISTLISTDIIETDPVRAYSQNSLLFLSQVYEPLYSYEYLKRPFKVIPLLAEGLPTIKDDGKLYEISLKKNISYHDSGMVEAKDVINQIKRLAIISLKSPIRTILNQKIVGFKEFGEKVKNRSDFDQFQISGVKELGKSKFSIALLSKDPKFIYWLTTLFFTPIRPSHLKANSLDLETKFIGTGAYQVSSFESKLTKLKGTSNYNHQLYPSSGDRDSISKGFLENSRDPLPLISNANIYIEKDFEKRKELFIEGKVDWMDVSIENLEKIKSDERIQKLLKKEKVSINYRPNLALRWLGFNMQDPVVGGNKTRAKNLRKAIALALDREDYIKKITRDSNLEANSLVNPGILGFNSSGEYPFSYNLEKAKDLVKGIPKPIKITYSTRSDQETSLQEAEYLKKTLAPLGVELEVEVLVFSDFLRKGRAGELQFWTDYWIYDYPDAENILQLLYSKNFPGINKSAYASSDYDFLFERLKFEKADVTQKEIIRKIEDLFYEDLPWILLGYDRSYYITWNHLNNLKTSSFIRNYFKFLGIK